MRIILVGADFEENLGVGAIAAVAIARGHEVRILPFNEPDEAPRIAQEIAKLAPDVVGLSMQFQHRAYEFQSLARRLRTLGVRAHLTAGGQFATLAYRDLLRPENGVDTVVLYDGEETFAELLDALASARPVTSVAGLALRDAAGTVGTTTPRPLAEDLDAFPLPYRYRAHTRHVGVPFVPIMGSRGCWGKCTYCSITTYFREARAHGGGKTFRLRSPEHIADEMADLQERAGEPCIFCFHDDNLLLPRPADTLARLRAIRARLDERGIGKVAIVGKCRPETVTPELAHELAALGVIRLYVGVENASENGAKHLARGKQHLALDQALASCRNAGIFTCYNLLVFEPDAHIEDIETNVAFIRRHARNPVNFCRAEPYYGTPLMLDLASRGNLGGSYLGYDYRIGDDRTELLFRISAAAFRERNFRADGVANRTMGVGYTLKVLEHFYDDPRGERAALIRRANDLVTRISTDTASHLEMAIALARDADLADKDAVERKTALLGLAISAKDAVFQRELDGMYEAMDRFRRRAEMAPAFRLGPGARRIARVVAATAGVALAAGPACGTTVDPLPSDASVVDPLPPDASFRDGGRDGTVVDPVPVDAGRDVTVVDPPPPDAGLDAGPDAVLDVRRLKLIDQWRETSPRRAGRSNDLPLSAPPDIRIEARRDGDTIFATLVGAEGAGVRWEADGTVSGDGHAVTWTPDGDDSLRVAARTKGGVAVVSLRASAVKA